MILKAFVYIYIYNFFKIIKMENIDYYYFFKYNGLVFFNMSLDSKPEIFTFKNRFFYYAERCSKKHYISYCISYIKN